MISWQFQNRKLLGKPQVGLDPVEISVLTRIVVVLAVKV